MMQRTKTFRDYAFESLSGGEFSIDTRGEFIAVLRLAMNHPEFGTDFVFERDVARQLGTDLLQWSGSPLCCTCSPVSFRTLNGVPLRVEVTDGQVDFLMPPRKAGDDDLELVQRLSESEVVDLAQRLIVWAGVDG